MALVISDNKDYKNNQVPSSTTSTIDINTDFYVGGVPNKVQAPFLKDNGIPVSIFFCQIKVVLLHFTIIIRMLRNALFGGVWK